MRAQLVERGERVLGVRPPFIDTAQEQDDRETLGHLEYDDAGAVNACVAVPERAFPVVWRSARPHSPTASASFVRPRGRMLPVGELNFAMTAQPQGLTLPEFIAWELCQEAKHEYVRGELYAFAGGTKRHALIAGAIAAALRSHLRDGPCLVFGSDVLITTARSARYPDVVVACDERDTRDLSEFAVRYPKLIVEVLSESTAATDRGDKLDEYRTLDSLEEYVLVDSRRRWVETYRRSGEGWTSSLPFAQGDLRFASVEAAISIEDLYSAAGL